MDGEWMWIVVVGFIVSIACASWVNGHAKTVGKDDAGNANTDGKWFRL